MDCHPSFTAFSVLLVLATLACSEGDFATAPPILQQEAHDPVPVDFSAAEPLPGEPVEFSLAGGPRIFSVYLESGDYLEVEAEQQKVDLALTWLDPDGLEILTVDSLNGPDGPETLAIVATVAGRHGLVVAPFPGQPVGEVRLHRVAVRAAREVDQRLARVLARFFQTPMGGDAVARRRLLGERQWQLEQLDGLDRPLLRARIERALGELNLQDGRVHRALQHFDRALPAVRVHSSGWELTALLNDLGYAARLSGEPEQARASFEESLELADILGHDLAAATALNNLGVLSEGLGELEDALHFYGRAVGRWRKLGSFRSLCTTLHNVGLTYLSLGMLKEAGRHLDQALELCRQTGDRQGEATTLVAVGWARSLEGDHLCALDLYDQALELRRALGDRRGEASTLDQRGAVLRALGRDEEALEDFEHALTLLRESGNQVSEAHVLANLGEVLLELNRSSKALEHHRAALTLFRTIGDRQGEARALIDLAAVEQRRGRPIPARQLYESALDLVESIRGRLQSPAFRTSYSAARYDAYSAYVDLLLELNHIEPDAGHAVRAFEAVERARARGLREGLGDSRGWWRDASVDLRVAEKRLRQQINLLEGRRFSLLEDGTGGSELEILEAEIEELVREYEKLEGRLRHSAGSRAAIPRAQTLKEIQAMLDPGTTVLVYHLGESEVVWLVGRDQFLMRSLQDQGTPAEKQGSSTETLAARTRRSLARSARAGRLAQARAEAALLAKRVLGPVVGELGKQVVIVAEGALATVPFAVLPVPDLELQKTELQKTELQKTELQKTRVPLMMEHEVTHLPAVSVLPLLRRNIGQASRLMAMIADPIFSHEDSRLASASTQSDAVALADGEVSLLATRDPEGDSLQRLFHSRVEAERILSLVRERVEDPSQWLKKVGADAHRDMVLKGELADYKIVHFATHGWIDDRHPTLSGLVMSRFDAHGRRRMGFLRVHEIERLDLAADLVVLSACRTALGDTVRGEGVVGMAHAFFRAGARRLIVSYWRVDDRATAVLMERFYRHLLVDELSPAAALAAAQRWMYTETVWRQPFYWGAFALQGDWR